MITNSQFIKIKTLQRRCGLDDDTYRDILRNQAGVNSCKELRSKRQIDSVTFFLINLADKIDTKVKRRATDWKWEDSPEGKALMAKAGMITKRPNHPSLRQFQYIFGLWWQLRSEWKKDAEQRMETTLNHFLEHGRGGQGMRVASWQWMTDGMAQNLINILKKRIADSKGKKTAAAK